MSKPQLSLRVPRNVRDEIETFQEQHDIEDRSEAARQLLRRGLQHPSAAPGEQLLRNMTGVAAVGGVVAAIAAGLGQAWAPPLVIPFGTAVVICSLLWASIRTLAGRDLV